MTEDQPNLSDLVAEAHRAMTALEQVIHQQSSKAQAAAISDGLNVYLRLLSYRETAHITMAETVTLQTAMELLMLRLHLFGESV